MKIGFYSDLVLGKDMALDSVIDRRMRETDLNFVNLECPLYSGKKVSRKKGVCLYSKADDLSFLSQYNVKAVNLANNHMMDFGPKGLQETMDKLDASGIAYFGAGESEEKACRPYFVSDGKKKIMITGFSWKYTGSVPAQKKTYGVAPISLEKIKRILEPYKAYDKKIAYFHFGTEFENFPEPYLKKLIEELLEEDYLDMVIGNHPHCIQGIYHKNVCGKEKVCFYSLGNFMIPEEEYYKGTLRYPEKSRLGFGVIYDSDKDGWELLPYHIEKRGKSLQASSMEELEEKIEAYSKPLYLSYAEYRQYYKKNRENKGRPLFWSNDTVNMLVSIPFITKARCFYFIYTSIKKMLWIAGFRIVRDANSGARKIVRGRK